MSKLIPLTRRLSRYLWQCTEDGYASMARLNHVYMHRIVAHTPKGLEADHINRNRLDNQEHNLRNVTRAENLKNRGPRNTVRYKVISSNTTRRKQYVNLVKGRIMVRESHAAFAKKYTELHDISINQLTRDMFDHAIDCGFFGAISQEAQP